MKYLIYILFLSITISGCNTYYSPNAHNTPQFSKKRELRTSIAYNTATIDLATEYQVAYSFSDKYAAMYNGLYANDSSDKLYYNEFGLGFFKKHDDFSTSEIYAGGGFGHSAQYDYFDSTNNHFIQLNYTKLWVQPTFGITSKLLDIIISMKLSYLNLFNLKTQSNSIYETDLIYIGEYKHNILIEPAITLRAGWDFIKLQLQITLSKNFTNSKMHSSQIFSEVRSPNSANINFGIFVTLDKLIEDTTEKKK